MTELAKDVAAIDVTDLLTRYSFDLSESTLDRLVDAWLNRYPTQWVRFAVIEALYQGRYKAISVEQILNLWQRRGKSLYHFNHEFERMVCGRFSYTQFSTPEPRFAAASRSTLNSSIPKASVPKASVPKASGLSRSTQPVSKPISSESTPEISTPQPALPQGEMGSSESIALPEGLPDINRTEINRTEINETTNLEAPVPEASQQSGTSGFSTISLSQTSLSQTSGSPVTTFQPSDSLDLEPSVTLSAARSPSQHQPIHHFVPSSQSSDFYAKLRAVAQAAAVAGSGE